MLPSPVRAGVAILMAMDLTSRVLVVLGLAAGVACAAGASRVLQSVLFGVDPLDPWSFAGATLVLLTIAVIAALTPTRSLQALDPAAVLRRD